MPRRPASRSKAIVLTDEALAALLAAGLRANGYAATWSSSQREAQRLLSSRAYRVVLLYLDSERVRDFTSDQHSWLDVGADRGPVARRVCVGDLVVDVLAHRCLVGGGEIALRPKEFDVLWLLMEHRGRLVSREQLIRLVWDENWRGSTKTLDVTVAGVRRRLREAAGAESHSLPTITAVRGCGYRLDPPTDPLRMQAAASA